MALTLLFICVFALASRSYGSQSIFETPHLKVACDPSDFVCSCRDIEPVLSLGSQLFFPPGSEYDIDILHDASSSSQPSACSVEPGSAEDVSKILRILGSNKTPFAVKGGGQTTNPGFSSTNGVEIAMTRFNQININSTRGTVEVGAGLTWDQVYKALEPSGVNVIGAFRGGVGVAGYTLGGGYSYKTSQFGLAIDNIVEYELVLPNATIINVTSNDEDLWFGLRGGMNNFGIVTKFTFLSHPQTDVWGGLRLYTENQLAAIKEALIKFDQNNDTKALIEVSVTNSMGQFLVVIIFFYDGPTPPTGVFDQFLAIPALEGNVSTSSFSDFVRSTAPLISFNGNRAFIHDAPVIQHSAAVFDAFVNQIKFWGEYLFALDKNVSLTATMNTFDKGLYSHGTDSAYPPDRSQPILPTPLTVQWSNSSLDSRAAYVLRSISDAIRVVAIADGQNVSHAAKYVNTALFDTPLEDMYGNNVERLFGIKAAIDPNDVMGLTGGWRF